MNSFFRTGSPAFNPRDAYLNLPKPPPGIGTALGAPGFPQSAPPVSNGSAASLTQPLPPAPPAPKKRPTAFDADNYQQTMLALAAGFFGSQNFGEGLGNAAQAIYGQNERLRKRGTTELGGPDDSFEIYTDPQTGERTYTPVQSFVDYNEKKRVKPKDIADMNGRAMYAISQMEKPEDQAAAFAEIRANPQFYGVDLETLPSTWNPIYGSVVGNMGMTVSQAMTRNQAGTNEDNREKHRNAADDDRTKRTDIIRDRAGTAASQGAQRLGIAREALGIRKAGGGAGGSKRTPINQQSNADLLSFVRGN